MSKSRNYQQYDQSKTTKTVVQPIEEISKDPVVPQDTPETEVQETETQKTVTEVTTPEQVTPVVEKQPEPEVKKTVVVKEPVAVPVQQKQPPSKETKPVYKIELDLTTYVEAMAPTNVIDPVEGGKSQNFLFMILRGILNAKDQETFNKEWSTLLNFVNKDTTKTFTEGFAFRFPEQWTGSNRDYATFRRLVYLIIQTADPKQRKKNAQDINLEMVTENMNEAQRSYVLNFYG